MGWEIFVVFAVSLGASGLTRADRADRIADRTAGAASAARAAGRHAGPGPSAAGPDPATRRRRAGTSAGGACHLPDGAVRRDAVGHGPGREPAGPGTPSRGAALAALIGGTGLALYLTAYKLGISLNVVPEDLPAIWWRIPVLILNAAQNGILEEVLVIGYLLRRLDQLDWKPWHAILFAAVLRGSYHLYQGFGGFLGNAAMGIIFGDPLPAVGAGHADDHRAHPDRHGRVRRLRRAARQGVLAALADPGRPGRPPSPCSHPRESGSDRPSEDPLILVVS